MRRNLHGVKTNKKSGSIKASAGKLVKNIRRKPQQTYSAEEKVRIVRAGMCGEESISVLCRWEGVAESLYHIWSKEFLEAGKRRLSGDTGRQATSPDVKELRSESYALKECVADLTLEKQLFKRSRIGVGKDQKSDTQLLKSLKSSARMRGPIYRPTRHSLCWAFPVLRSIIGVMCI